MRSIHAMFAVALLAVATTAGAVDLHGYFRQGVGGSSKGGDQVAFSNTNQGYTLRLGNESNWSEFEFVQLIQKDKNGVEWSAGFMLGWGNGFTTNQDMVNGGSGRVNTNDSASTGVIETGYGSLALQQEYIRATFPQLGGATVWGGKRFYHRHANDIFDYFYMNESGPGVGIEDIDVGFGKLSAALFRFQDRQPGDDNDPATIDYAPSFWMPDLRLEGIPVNPGGTLNIAVLARLRSWNKDVAGEKAPDGTSSFGVHAMVKHSQANILNGGNNIALDFKNTCFLGNACNEKAWRFTASEDLLLQPTKQLAVNFAAIYMYDKLGSDSNRQSLGVGVRPMFKIADHFGIQGDAGYFWNKTKGDSKANTMVKLTVAPTITPFTDGFAWGVRPEIRFYATYASWNKEQSPAGNTFGTDENGMTFGTQVDTWF